jgi:hypothetical protein
MYIDYIVFIYILHQSEKLMKSISILSYLMETDIGGKGTERYTFGGNGYWWKTKRSTFGGNVLHPFYTYTNLLIL